MAAQRKPYYGRLTTRIQEHVGVLGDYKCAQDLLIIDLLVSKPKFDQGNYEFNYEILLILWRTFKTS